MFQEYKDFVDPLYDKYCSGPVTYARVPTIDLHPGTYELTRMSFGLLLPEGHTLSCDPPNKYWGDLDAFVKVDSIRGISVMVHRWDWDDVPEAARKVELVFAFPDSIGETLGVYVSNSGYVVMCRNVHAFAYAETGYEGHNQECKTPDERQALGFLEYIRGMVGTG